MYSVRLPTPVEQIKLAKCIMNDYVEFRPFATTVDGESLMNMTDLIRDSCVTVVEHYVSDTPSYCGTIFTITWGEVCFISRILVDMKSGEYYVDHSWRDPGNNP